jgi:general secretion pathway protein F
MNAFEYAALDAQGKTRKGVLEGDTPRQIRQQLRERGWIPISVSDVRHPRERRRKLRFIKGITGADTALVFRQLGTMVRSGLSLEDALRATANQATKGRVNRIMLGVRARVLEGHSLAKSLGDFPHVFPPLFPATVAAGEQTGHLARVLERLADYAERRQQLQQRIMMALLHPAFLTVVAMLVVVGLIGYVVPQVVQVFEGIGQDLPWLTRALIGLSDFLVQWGSWLLATLALAVLGTRYLLRAEQPRRWLHRGLLALPIISRLVRGLNATRFCATLGMLMVSAVPMLEALRITSGVMSNLAMRAVVDDATRTVKEGGSLHSALQRGQLFPPVTVQLIASGETSGNLGQMLERAAESQQRETETLLMTLLGLFEPLLILLMGGIVLMIVLAILLPIFELNQLVK